MYQIWGGTYYASSDGLDGYSSVRVAEASYTQAADTGWQEITLDQGYLLPSRASGDLSAALSINISGLSFRPRLVMLEPASNAAAAAVTPVGSGNNRFLMCFTELTATGERDTTRGFFALTLLTNNTASLSDRNIGLYPDSNWEYLYLCSWLNNAAAQNTRINAGSWRWRAIG